MLPSPFLLRLNASESAIIGSACFTSERLWCFDSLTLYCQEMLLSIFPSFVSSANFFFFIFCLFFLYPYFFPILIEKVREMWGREASSHQRFSIRSNNSRHFIKHGIAFLRILEQPDQALLKFLRLCASNKTFANLNGRNSVSCQEGAFSLLPHANHVRRRDIYQLVTLIIRNKMDFFGLFRIFS